MGARRSSPWLAISIALLVVGVIYTLELVVTGEGVVEHWDDLLLPIAVSSIAAAVIGWRIGARRADDVRAELERDMHALRERIVALERELEAAPGGPELPGLGEQLTS